MTSEIVALELLKLASLTFAPGLFEVLQPATPPTIDFFKGLPSVTSGTWWGVYVLVLEKSRRRPKIYIGSGTKARDSIRSRMNQYEKGVCLPQHVETALKQGYEITHTGLLCWAPKPASSNHLDVQMIIIAIEATFSFFFWAMCSRTKDYLMSHACTWNIKSFTYDGCCGHSSLKEGFSNADFTAEEVEAKVSQIAENTRVNMRTWLKNNQDKSRATIERSRSKALASKKYRCEPCNKTFDRRLNLEQHYKSPKHKTRINGTVSAIVASRDKHRIAKTYYCATCDRAFGCNSSLVKHNKSDRHLLKVTAAKKKGKKATKDE